jgi:peptidyl-prolyl cis-trans isomerase SurA
LIVTSTMSAVGANSVKQASRTAALCALTMLCALSGHAQQSQQNAVLPGVPAKTVGAAQQTDGSVAGAAVTLDRVVAIVNGDLILESDVDAERRFAAFQPFSEPKPVSDDDLVNRLIDRTLILQQMVLQPGPRITDSEVDAELAVLRKSIPKCAAEHCETDAGWQKFVADRGFTMDELRDRWRQRMEVLRFIEQRFRMGIRISQAEIDAYYKTTMLPVYAKENAQAPAEATIADRIQEILLQQRVDKLLDDWLTSLRAEGGVRILKPGEEAP